MTLLTTIQGACDRIGLSRPSAVVSSSDQQVRELLALANEEGMELSRRADWQALTKEQTFTSLAQETQTSMVPADYDRFVSDTFWNRTRKRAFQGPVTSQDWQYIKAMTTAPLPEVFIYRGNDILIQPVPTAGDTFAFNYVSKNWCQSSGGTAQDAWAADTDTGLLPERLITLGTVFRWKAMKGLSADIDGAMYDTQVRQALLRDKPARTLNMAGEGMDRRPGIFVPEGDWSL